VCLDTFLSLTFLGHKYCILVDRDVGHWGGTAVGCNSQNSQNTKQLELRFRAWLNEEGTRQIELARA
jgi:hypothetical protein